MRSLWEQDARLEILRRIDAVAADAKPQWGRMSAGRMLRHLAQSLAMANDEVPMQSKKLPIRYFPLKQLIIYVFPFPKGAPTSPELLEGDDTSVDAARADLRRGIETFAARTGAASWPEHPAFGHLSRRAWGVLTYKHCDHHLRQFGV
jgi:Protein of unknown function (DUF1569)